MSVDGNFLVRAAQVHSSWRAEAVRLLWMRVHLKSDVEIRAYLTRVEAGRPAPTLELNLTGSVPVGDRSGAASVSGALAQQAVRASPGITSLLLCTVRDAAQQLLYEEALAGEFRPERRAAEA